MAVHRPPEHGGLTMARIPLQWIELWDGRRELGWHQDGLPTFRFGHAPTGLATRRQLRTAGLCPGGQDFVAQLVWRQGRAWAGLFRLDLAQPQRKSSPGQRAAIEKALAARRTCPTCPPAIRLKPYYLPTSTGQCWTCSLPNIDDLAA